jgi:integrase
MGESQPCYAARGRSRGMAKRRRARPEEGNATDSRFIRLVRRGRGSSGVYRGDEAGGAGKRQDIEDWLAESDWSPRTRKNYAVTLTTIFNFALRREYLSVNPAALVRRPVLDDTVPGILTPNQAEQLLTKTFELDKGILPGVAVGLFAGLRRSEICSLDWNEINLTERTIVVLGRKAKTRQRRVVTISDNLMPWLVDELGSGPLTYTSPDLFGERLRAMAKEVGILEWPHNALRHSFGSYFYALRKNENSVAAEMGNSPAVVFRHYRALVKGEDAIRYWSLVPEKELTE